MLRGVCALAVYASLLPSLLLLVLVHPDSQGNSVQALYGMVT